MSGDVAQTNPEAQHSRDKKAKQWNLKIIYMCTLIYLVESKSIPEQYNWLS